MLLTEYLPADSKNVSDDEIYEAFGQWVTSRGITLYPAQDEASMALAGGNNVILATPTGSGKSMVAIAAHFYAMARDQISFYTAPIKALVSEKFFDLCKIFGAENVGMVTGDSSVNADAPIICCTAEILANIALREGSKADVGCVIMDEFHFYADPQRGWAWQVPLIELPQAQFLLMSATLGDVTRFEKELEERTGTPTVTVAHTERPIPLHFYYSMEPVQEAVEELIKTKQVPIYIVHFSQLDAIDRATGLMSINVATREEKEKISEMIGGFRFAAGFGKTLNRLVRHGIGIHHAGMLPKYRRLVEQLAQAGLLKVICGTDTLGVGINVPIRTVVITALSKFDGTRTRIVNAREFHQIAGRAGRAGFDTAGTVLVQAPEHAIENHKAMEKALKKHGEGSSKLKQIPKKKPPQNFVTWGEKTFEKIVAAPPETLKSSFQVSHSMLLNLLEREDNAFEAAVRLLSENHETPAAQRKLKLRAIGILRELIATEVVVRRDEPDEYGNYYELTVHLQQNFALNQPLSPFALAALDLLDPDSASYALDVVSVIEATLEKPRQVLSGQEKKARGEAIAAMKAEGMDYNDRMNALDEITYPMPLAEKLESAFEQYRSGAPWLADFELQPKSIVRDMYERAMGFSDFVQYYQLARSEGVLLRYLTDAYKALRQTVPQDALREDLEDLIEWLGEMIRQIDSSLLDEWEELSRGELSEETETAPPPAPEKLTSNKRAFRVMVRNEMFRRVKLFADEQDQALGELDEHNGFDADAWADAMDGYFDEHDDIDDGPTGRSSQLFIVNELPHRVWEVRQIFADPSEHHDWGISATISLDDSDEVGAPVVTVTSVGRLD
ncbi:DEAD/DEAH box helicase [Arthrobacter sp. NIO-1057]|uniref:DEAD/DEAH box helicase n=1 Tax=Arthrobacter sp. NIO-1057 TaxID=993071 RepID=UPI00071CA673|nr:DEAD/DEAH box helicase [Arthrobacter sp. NIO-1057]KSU68156.1 DEAD/DEAH box helicase [Arthrobacter sp. NIO-1057]SCB90220.1 Helicase conserved C-terminal domain-containing protein [Arthrobacter sp. NIO-1057]